MASKYKAVSMNTGFGTKTWTIARIEGKELKAVRVPRYWKTKKGAETWAKKRGFRV